MLARFVVNSHVRHHPNAPKDDDDMQQVCWKKSSRNSHLPSFSHSEDNNWCTDLKKNTELPLKFADFNS